ncbi:FkbM family methyltransferase [Oxyplasma meridianum]|uniref:FkbM family methyltransferase n=1 Tax=Oxyplasma meridianum TaxID=3073602 RepID=UPI00372D5733
MLKNISNEDIVVNAGANIGIFTVLASSLAKQVIAFEPDIANLRILRENLELNKIKNVTVISR